MDGEAASKLHRQRRDRCSSHIPMVGAGEHGTESYACKGQFEIVKSGRTGLGRGFKKLSRRSTDFLNDHASRTTGVSSCQILLL
jgi:hypothetical protein